MENETCYIFTPDELDGHHHRPSKRRKTGKALQSADDDLEVPFVPLLGGAESSRSVRCRALNYSTIWRSQEKRINEIFQYANEETIDELVSYAVAQDISNLQGKLPTGLIAAGPDSDPSMYFAAVAGRLDSKEPTIFVQLSSEQCPNLKATLKYINQSATRQMGEDVEDSMTSGGKHNRYPNYDLEMLHDYIQSQSVHKVILAIQDSEAFEGTLLADLIEVLSSWIDRIPFLLLFTIATSIELFQAKLPRETVRRLAGVQFHVKRIETDDIFKIIHNENPALLLGATISELILQQQHDIIHSPVRFKWTLKYAYMTHFFANPLSILVCDVPTSAPLQKEHYEAIRNLPSFRRYAQMLIDVKDYDTVRDMLDDDESFNGTVMRELATSGQALKGILSALSVLCRLQSNATSKSNTPWSKLYVQAVSGTLLESTTFNDIVNPIKKLQSDAMHDLLGKIADVHLLDSDLATNLAAIKTDLEQMTGASDDGALPLKSLYSIQHSTIRTTVVAQKVSLSKNLAKTSSGNTGYTEIVDRSFETFKTYFESALINPSDLFLHEILIYDSRSPYREAFTPRPRFAIERALSSSRDYLGCECCSSGEDIGLEASQPATSILYQLYLESGSAINTADLWEAFWTIIGGEGGVDEDGERHKAFALFSRGLAELRYLGMIKNNSKKADHLQKLAWKGL